MSSPPATDARRKSELISKVIMKKCHSILCHVAAKDTKKVLSDLVGRKFNSEYKDLRVIFESEPTRYRPSNLDFFMAHMVIQTKDDQYKLTVSIMTILFTRHFKPEYVHLKVQVE